MKRMIAGVAFFVYLLAFPVLAVQVGGIDMNAGDLGGGEDGDGTITIGAGSSTLIEIDIGRLDDDLDGGGPDDDDDDDDDGGVMVGNTGVSATLAPNDSLGQTTQTQDPSMSTNPSSGTQSSSGPTVYFNLVERRPDFEYVAGSLKFQPTETYDSGQKAMGIGPGLRNSGTRYLPLGEF